MISLFNFTGDIMLSLQLMYLLCHSICDAGQEASEVVFEVLEFLSYLGVRYDADIYFGFGQETNKELGTQYPRQNASIAVVGYAMRFLKYNNSLGPSLQAHAPTTPDRTSDLGIAESSLEEHLAEVQS